MPAARPEPPAPTRTADPVEEDLPAEHRVHHHARVERGPGATGRGGGIVRTLCGLTLRPRPDARRMPCCPMCAERMGGPCRHGR